MTWIDRLLISFVDIVEAFMYSVTFLIAFSMFINYLDNRKK